MLVCGGVDDGSCPVLLVGYYQWHKEGDWTGVGRQPMPFPYGKSADNSQGFARIRVRFGGFHLRHGLRVWRKFDQNPTVTLATIRGKRWFKRWLSRARFGRDPRHIW